LLLCLKLGKAMPRAERRLLDSLPGRIVTVEQIDLLQIALILEEGGKRKAASTAMVADRFTDFTAARNANSATQRRIHVRAMLFPAGMN
jgi:phosphoglycolate phosphatase-like HAD superfamily hydrolase